MKQQNNFSKKPWITAFFPRGTVVEFDTMLGSEFGSSGVGTVQTVTVTHHDNTVLTLGDVTLTKGVFYRTESVGEYNLSSSYVTKIVKRGEGEVVHTAPYRNDYTWSTHNKHRVHRYELMEYFSQLVDRLPMLQKQMVAINVVAMRIHFISMHPNHSMDYSSKFVKKWFMRNYNRFLQSNRDIEIAKYFSNTMDNFNFEEDMDMVADDCRNRYQSTTPQSVFSQFQQLLNHQFRNREWVVLTKELTAKHLKYDLPVYQVTISAKAREAVHIFTDKENLVELLETILQSPYSEYADAIEVETRKAVQEDIEAFDYSDEKHATALNGLYSAIGYLHYLLTDYNPNYKEEDFKTEGGDVHDDHGLDDYRTFNDSDF